LRSTSYAQQRKRLPGCFVDHREPDLIEHSVASLIKQRVYGIALGYEDLNDHDSLRHGELLAVLSDKTDPTGGDRVRESDKGKALAGKSKPNRLELTPPEADEKSRYKKIVAAPQAMDTLLVETFLESYSSPPAEIILDVDATDHRRSVAWESGGAVLSWLLRAVLLFAVVHLLR
jgi:hypothetical protein